MSKTIFDLELHETMNVERNIQVTRVPGGWIYTINGCDNCTSTFVPWTEQI